MSSLVNATTIDAITSASQAELLSLILVLILLVSLIWKEIVGVVNASWAYKIAHALYVVLLPCGLAFLFIAVVNVLAVLR